MKKFQLFLLHTKMTMPVKEEQESYFLHLIVEQSQ